MRVYGGGEISFSCRRRKEKTEEIRFFFSTSQQRYCELVQWKQIKLEVPSGNWINGVEGRGN